MTAGQQAAAARACRFCASSFVPVKVGRLASFCRPCARWGGPYKLAKSKVHNAVARAIKQGALPRPATMDCTDCGKPAAQFDHRDYTKPLQVEPVCRRCNILRGPAEVLKESA
jgi:hypothetical protein